MAKRVGLRLMGNPGHNRVVTCSDVLACLEGFTQEEWEAITNLFTAITEHLGDLTQAQWEAITNLFLAINAHLEGSYTTWAYLGKVQCPIVGATDDIQLLRVDNLGNIHYLNHDVDPGSECKYYIWNKSLVVQIDGEPIAPAACLVHAAPSASYGDIWYQNQSINLKYTALIDQGGASLLVYRNYPIVPGNSGWTSLFTRDLSDDYADVNQSGYIHAITISPNGKYIAILVENVARDEQWVMLYEGS